MKAYQLTGLLLALTGCPQVKKLDEGPTGGGGVPDAVQARFTQYCALPNCHNGGPIAPDLTAGAAADSITLMSSAGTPYVTFGDVENSWIAQRILPGDLGPMPPASSPQPTPEDVAIVLGWIAGAPFPEGESATDTATATMSDTDGMSDTDTESTGAAEPLVCSLELIDASADVAAAIDAGDGAGQIPTEVGDVLLANCGCHYTSNVSDPYAYGAYGGAQGMASLEDFTGDWAGIIPMFTGPAHEAFAMRIDGLQMPPAECDAADGMPATQNDNMSQADYDLLADWLGQGAPDGASYP